MCEAARLGLVLPVDAVGGEAGAVYGDQIALDEAGHRLIGGQRARELADRAGEGGALRLRGQGLGLGLGIGIGFGLGMG